MSTFQVEVQVAGEATKIDIEEGSTAQTVYDYVSEKVGLSLSQVRVLVNSVTVEPAEAVDVLLAPGDLIDVVPEINNG